LHELQKELGARLSIPVLLQDAHVNVPEFRRDPLKRHLAEVRSSLLAAVTQDVRLASFLKERGLTETKLQQDEGVVAACRHLSFESGGTNALAQFDAGMRQLAQAPKQWDIDDLLRNLKAAVQPFRKDKVYFLGVANLDAYMNQSNFIFGSAENNGHHAVITYRRFTADFNGETPNRHRLVDRTLRQSLSSLGFMLGIQRCSTPTCARAYPHNLSEHDAKSDDLCTACRSGFERVLGVSLERKKTDQQSAAPLPSAPQTGPSEGAR
jgi:predicted Zn-dependent protease